MKIGLFENGMYVFKKKISDSIKQDGVYVQVEEGYTYTVGMMHHGLPEIVCNLGREECFELVLVLTKAVELRISEIQIGKNIPNILYPEPFMMEISESEKRLIFHGCRSYYSDWNFQAAKLIV